MAEQGARLLVADDNKVNRLLLSRNLELQGHRVASAATGRIALQMLREQAFDLLLLDVEMPELNGFQVLEQLRHDSDLRDLPVIVTSSLEGVAHVVRCIELGADDFLHKHASTRAWKRSACATSRRRSSGALRPAKWRKTCSNRASRSAAGACTPR
jgi:CheY-like chemotaxis protein